MKELDKQFTVNFCHSRKEAWSEVVSRFKDANLYQTWPYDRVRFDEKSVLHMVLRKKDDVVAAAQARIVQLPLIKIGIAYVLWGPMWQLFNTPDDEVIFRQAIRALRNEFSFRRRLVLRLFPLAYHGDHEGLAAILREEDYQPYIDGGTYRTLIVPIDSSLEKIRASLDQKWRNCLNRAEKNGLEIICGDEDSLFAEFAQIHQEMIKRKELFDISDVRHLRAVQKELTPDSKLKVILCRKNGELCAGGIFSSMGTTGVYLSGATSDTGLATNGSYLVQWAFVKWLKDSGFTYYNLNGINPEKNPGTYRFKRGLAGKLGYDVKYLGRFQVSDRRISGLVVNRGESFLSVCKHLSRQMSASGFRRLGKTSKK